MDLAEWADAHAILSAESSAEVGRWRTIPYQRGIMNACTDPDIEKVSVEKSARVGYTKILNHLIGYHIHYDPCGIMVVQPTIEDAEGYSKDEIAPMLRDTPVLAAKFAAKSRDSNNTILQKNFPGGVIGMVGANSPRGFRRVSRRIVIFDEVDGYPPSAGEEGDQIKLGTMRSQYFWNRKIVAGSTPTVKDFSKIEGLFLAGDQRRFFVACPHCDAAQYLKWGGRDKPYGIKWPDGEPEKAYYACEANGCVIEHKHKRQMIEDADRRQQAGEPGIGWVATNPHGEPGHASFHIWAAYSYSPNATWGHLAAEFAAACKDAEQLRTFVNTTLGETWEEEYSAKIGAEGLLARVESYQEDIAPEGVTVITAGVDVQPDRLEVTLFGWGDGEEAWRLAHHKIAGDPMQDAVWDELDKILTAGHLHETAEPLPISVCAIDSGDGNTVMAVYNYTRERKALWRQQRFPCQVVATKGASTPGKPPINKGTPVDFKWHATTYKAGATVHSVGSDTIKGTLYARLRTGEPGPGFVHFPASADQDYFKQLTAEKRVIYYKHGNPVGRWEKKNGDRNEALDCAVYAYAALHLMYSRFNRKTFWETMRNRLILREKEVIKEKKAEHSEELPKKTRRHNMPPRKSWVSKW